MLNESSSIDENYFALCFDYDLKLNFIGKTIRFLLWISSVYLAIHWLQP
jgi:hypothetical protein